VVLGYAAGTETNMRVTSPVLAAVDARVRPRRFSPAAVRHIRAALPLSDRGELRASQFRVNQEAERIQKLALLHQPDHNRLPELS
jgi:hypothetical protein